MSPRSSFSLTLSRSHGIKLMLLLGSLVTIWLLVFRAPQIASLTRPSRGRTRPEYKPPPPPPVAYAGYSRPSENPQVPSDNETSAEYLCSLYRVPGGPWSPPARSVARPRRVYDLLLVNDELEMLELRLAQMYDDVDYFVILESDRTFSLKPKPLHVLDAWDRFHPYHAKMIRQTLASYNPESSDPVGTAWYHEVRSRNALLTQSVRSLAGTDRAALAGDVLLVSDVDEIPKPGALRALRACDVPPRTSLLSDFYYYSFEWRARVPWPYVAATTYRPATDGDGQDETVLPDDLRMGPTDLWIWHAAWHCSYCFRTIGLLINKVASFSHTNYNVPKYKDPKTILARVRHGLDFYGREEEVLDYVPGNQDVPDVVKREPERYRYLLDRKPEHGNFADYDEYF